MSIRPFGATPIVANASGKSQSRLGSTSFTLTGWPQVLPPSVERRHEILGTPGAMSTGTEKVRPPSAEAEIHGRARMRLSTRRHHTELSAPVMDEGMFQVPLPDHQAT